MNKKKYKKKNKYNCDVHLFSISCDNFDLFHIHLLKVERLSIDPESKGAIKPGSGKPL